MEADPNSLPSQIADLVLVASQIEVLRRLERDLFPFSGYQKQPPAERKDFDRLMALMKTRALNLVRNIGRRP
jgi:hypothetical protein